MCQVLFSGAVNLLKLSRIVAADYFYVTPFPISKGMVFMGSHPSGKRLALVTLLRRLETLDFPLFDHAWKRTPSGADPRQLDPPESAQDSVISSVLCPVAKCSLLRFLIDLRAHEPKPGARPKCWPVSTFWVRERGAPFLMTHHPNSLLLIPPFLREMSSDPPARQI